MHTNGFNGIWMRTPTSIQHRPATLLRNLVAAGWYGKKVGRGFYVYDDKGQKVGRAFER